MKYKDKQRKKEKKKRKKNQQVGRNSTEEDERERVVSGELCLMHKYSFQLERLDAGGGDVCQFGECLMHVFISGKV